jgi:hypothetical protein
VADIDLRKAERRASGDESAQRGYLITQLRSGQYDPSTVIQCVLNKEDPEMAQRCLHALPQILQDNPKQVVNLAIGMAEWWDRTASDGDENHYFGLDDVHDVIRDFLNNNPLEIRHLLDQLGYWHGEANRPSYHQDSYPEVNHGYSIAMNILSELNMLEAYQDYDYDHIDYTLAWVWYCGQRVSEAHIDHLAFMLWNQLQTVGEFTNVDDPEVTQSLSYLALKAIKDHSLRNDFIEKFDFFRGETDLISIYNPQLEADLNVFADAFQSGSLLGGGALPNMTIGEHEANPGIIDRGIERLNGFTRLPEIREMVVRAFS